LAGVLLAALVLQLLLSLAFALVVLRRLARRPALALPMRPWCGPRRKTF
jgi:hypothetical protein